MSASIYAEQFPWDKVDAAKRYLYMVKPWWARFGQKLKVVPVYQPPQEGKPYGSITSTDGGFRLYIDVGFAAWAPLHLLAGAIEHEFQHHTRDSWNRLSWLSLDEWRKWANIAFDLEINGGIEYESSKISMDKIRAIAAKSNVFVDYELDFWSVTDPPGIGEEGWLPRLLGLPDRLSAEEYLNILQMAQKEPPPPPLSDETSEDSDSEGEQDEQQQDDSGSSGANEDQSEDSESEEQEQESDSSSSEQEDNSDGSSSEEDEQEDNEESSEQESGDGSESEDQSNEDDETSEGDSSEEGSESQDGDGSGQDDDSSQEDSSESDGSSDGDNSESGNQDSSEDSDSGQSTSEGSDSEVGSGDSQESKQGSADSNQSESADQSDQQGEGVEGSSLADKIKELRTTGDRRMWSAELGNPQDDLIQPAWKPEDRRNEKPLDRASIEGAMVELEEDITEHAGEMGDSPFGLTPGANMLQWVAKRRRVRGVDWQSRLNKLLSSSYTSAKVHGASDLSYTVRNPNQPEFGVILQGLHDYAPTVVVIQDVSGSMLINDRMNKSMSAFTDLCGKVLGRFNSPVTWVTVDAGIIDVGSASSWNKHQQKRWSYGFGGTEIAPAIEQVMTGKLVWKKKKYPKADLTIVSTDCIFEWPKRRPIRNGKLLVVSVEPDLKKLDKFLPKWLDRKRELVIIGD